jgi:putative oxidoreductase
MFQKLIATTTNWVTVPLRLALGLVFIAHGSQKVFGAFGGKGLSVWIGGNAPMGLKPAWLWLGAAAFSEFVGGCLVLIGLLTRAGAFLILAVMVVAVSGVHWGTFFLPAGFEYAMTLLLVALALLIAGGGAASADRALMSNRSPRRR